MTTGVRAAAPRRQLIFAVAVAGVAAVIAGLAIAWVGYSSTAGPGGAVRGYFAALGRGDAPAALAFGDVPEGDRSLLTRTVLREQLRIAAVHDVSIASVRRNGDRAVVQVDYTLSYTDTDVPVHDTVTVLRHGHDWRLASVAARTRLSFVEAGERASVLDAQVPDGEVLLFPGAAPVRLDTPLLAIDPATTVVTLSTTRDLAVRVVASDEGRAAARQAVLTALRACVGADADPRCPLPDGRAVPRSLRARLPADAASRVAVGVPADPAGLLEVTGTIRVTGSYSVLDFDNVASVRHGATTLHIRARAYAWTPVVVDWEDSGS